MSEKSLPMSLENYANLRRAFPRRTSSYDRTGANIDCLTDLAPGSTTVLLEADGPGKITHLWMTMLEYPGHETLARDIVLRMYWEGSSVPSVEVPIGDFFGLGHALTPQFYERRKFMVNSAPSTVGGNERAMNCYWPMPFRQSARIEIFNNGAVSCKLFYYHVDYELGEQPADAGLFHAVFKSDLARHGQAPNEEYRNLDGKDNFVMLETTGRGHYAGCFYYADTDPGGWWGEGDEMIFLDHSAMPVIYGTGTEDYFNNAWGFREPYCFPYYGAPLLAKRPDGGEWSTLYRFHIPDPVHFQEHIKVTMECWWEPEKTISIACVAFWYQDKPVAARDPLPAGAANHPRRHPLAPEDRWDYGASPEGVTYIWPHHFEEPLLGAGWKVRTVNRVGARFLYTPGSAGGIVIESEGRELALPLTVPDNARYRVEVKPLYTELQGSMKFRLGDTVVEATHRSMIIEDEGPVIHLGEAVAQDGKIVLHVSGEPLATVHVIRLTRLSNG
jgi:hypothetical protein